MTKEQKQKLRKGIDMIDDIMEKPLLKRLQMLRIF